ncbi:MAG TPA: hypothetical protein PK406_09900 [Verrucomicrobiota bacterium]|nr:hypothetical protein [Verrucomicrobiota bacterium]
MNTRELIRKGFYAGIGVLSLTREKAWVLADALVKRGETRYDEVEALVGRWVNRGEQEREALRKRVRGEIERALSAGDFATKEDIAALSKKVEALAQ